MPDVWVNKCLTVMSFQLSGVSVRYLPILVIERQLALFNEKHHGTRRKLFAN